MKHMGHRFAHRAMGTTFEVVLDLDDRDYAASAAQEVFRLIDRVNTALTHYDTASDLNMVNRAPLGEWIAVSPDLQECLLVSRTMYDRSDGLFNPSFRKPAGFAKLEIDPKLARVRPSAPIDLELGGIGKGFALDQARELLQEWEVDRAALHSGGSSVLALDAPRKKRGWRVQAGHGQFLWLERRSISASGTAVRGHHLIDPETGAPPKQERRVWALAPTAAESDALSTAFFLMSEKQILAYCARHPEVGAQWEADGALKRAGNWPESSPIS